MIFPESLIPYFILLNDRAYSNEENQINPSFGATKHSFIALYVVEDKEGYILNGKIVRCLSAKLKLFHSPLKYTGGEVCFLNSEEVRPEYKLSFSTRDIFDYISGYLSSSEYANNYKNLRYEGFPFVPFPENELEFWRFVQIGKENKS